MFHVAITHGLPGSGKTFASQRLLEAAGAIRIRSDVERKRLFGLSPLQASGEHARATTYGFAATEKTYAVLRAAARQALQSGWPTIVDAAFLKRSERTDFEGLALSLGLDGSYFRDRYTSDPLVLFRIFNYPPPTTEQELQSSWGVGEHTDYGVLTILRQDDCGGLEVKSRGGWVQALPCFIKVSP